MCTKALTRPLPRWQGRALRDELRTFESGRYYSASEAAWRYLGFPLYQQSHHVERLPVHLPNQQNVVFSDDSNLLETLQMPQTSKLLQGFKLNSRNAAARQHLYHELPAHYRWENKRWQPRRRDHMPQLGRMVFATPKDGER